jgi:hypothetical protein
MAMTIRTIMLAGVAGAAILATVPFGPQPVMAQNTYGAPDQGQTGGQPQEMRKRQQGQTSDDQSTREMRKQRAEGQEDDEQASREMKREGKREGKVVWDRDRHGERSRRREGRFRHFHDGFYYATPWWTTGIVVDGGIGCREGARIVSRRGFNRVVAIDCGGETYTYRGWRGGEPWRVRVDSDSGRIVAVRPAG